MCYGFASIPAAYCLSALFKQPSLAQISVVFVFFATGFGLFVTSFILSGSSDTAKDATDDFLNPYLFQLFPGFCLGQGFYKLSTLSFFNSLIPDEAKRKHPLDSDQVGGLLLYL